VEDKISDLSAAIKKSQRNATFKQQKKDLLEEFERKLSFPHKGGMFKATAEFLAQIQTLRFPQSEESFIVLDINKRPVEANKAEFSDLVREKYTVAVNWYYGEFTKLEKARTVEAMICPKEA
jgi:hypothetical protein